MLINYIPIEETVMESHQGSQTLSFGPTGKLLDKLRTSCCPVPAGRGGQDLSWVGVLRTEIQGMGMPGMPLPSHTPPFIYLTNTTVLSPVLY